MGTKASENNNPSVRACFQNVAFSVYTHMEMGTFSNLYTLQPFSILVDFQAPQKLFSCRQTAETQLKFCVYIQKGFCVNRALEG